MDFPLPLTLVLMLDDEGGAASSRRPSTSDEVDPGRASGVFFSNDRDDDALGLSERVA